MITRRMSALIFVSLAAPILASCSFSVGGSSIDQDKVTESITETFNKTLAPLGHTTSTVTCDDPGKNPADGTEFDCIATASGTDFNVVSTVAGNDVNFKFVERPYDMKKTAETLTAAVTEKMGGVKAVDCGEGLRAYAPGATFTCGVGDSEGNTGTLTYTVSESGSDDQWVVR
ncbi:DUF4333 domain-containing protein [Gordonia sp. (in: high G+C Gram-positive bacteria)]|uniref:DUF4333 domain-containing protein n=1 Tax=Gordonia sp. (in: high G+C Gram-positive bacteria) TaxID=84139 RepID=UPI00168ED977|nr:DUF4333 domain-containing protein [Gordonia sp. (in: high G+C Gram-positive bacteria)]NLG45160.1 DUF4333 domain-containing protein [Gordonia sp. (in: high G+C Gram-positive bacteria)]